MGDVEVLRCEVYISEGRLLLGRWKKEKSLGEVVKTVRRVSKRGMSG
jgi:hypothetical protein